jgi:hypothetical protein
MVEWGDSITLGVWTAYRWATKRERWQVVAPCSTDTGWMYRVLCRNADPIRPADRGCRYDLPQC